MDCLIFDHKYSKGNSVDWLAGSSSSEPALMKRKNQPVKIPARRVFRGCRQRWFPSGKKPAAMPEFVIAGARGGTKIPPMTNPKLIAAIWLGCLLGASAGQPASVRVAPTESKFTSLDVVTGSFTYTEGMDFDDLDGSLNVTKFDFLSLLSKPIHLGSDIMIVPAVQYGLTSFDFDFDGKHSTVAGDEDLHSLSLHLAAMKMSDASPWFYGAWFRAELASDFQHVNGDDFTFDIAAGVGYRFSDSFTLAAGAAVLNLNGDTWVCPGINFDWVVNDKTRIGLYGPLAFASYAPNEDWSFSLRGKPGGGIWNITDGFGDSKSVDLSSYQVGAFVSRRLTGKLWLNAGAGLAFANSLEYSDPDGDHKILDEDMDSAFFGQIGLSLKAW
jgi:hypothetical protein